MITTKVTTTLTQKLHIYKEPLAQEWCQRTLVKILYLTNNLQYCKSIIQYINFVNFYDYHEA